MTKTEVDELYRKLSDTVKPTVAKAKAFGKWVVDGAQKMLRIGCYSVCTLIILTSLVVTLAAVMTMLSRNSGLTGFMGVLAHQVPFQIDGQNIDAVYLEGSKV